MSKQTMKANKTGRDKEPKALPDVRKGDKWRSTGARPTTVQVKRYGRDDAGNLSVWWVGVDVHREGRCLARTFPVGRKLVERDGKAVPS